MIKIFLTFLIVFFSVSNFVHAACTGSSPTWTTTVDHASVSSCISSAVSGDTINISSGTGTWGDANYIYATGKNLTIVGAGIGSTIIDKTGDNSDTWQQSSAFWLEGITGVFRISGIEFQGDGPQKGMIRLSGTSTQIRIDNCKFELLYDADANADRAIETHGVFGVIDNNVFHETTDSSSVKAISVYGDSGTSWLNDEDLGTANALYIEDNTFDYPNRNDGALDAYDGAKYVFRYNTVLETNVEHHGADSGGFRGTYTFEVYGNSFTRTTASNIRGFHARSGTGVLHNNTYSAWYGSGMQLANYRSCGSYAPWGQCDGANISCSGVACDNEDDATGWLCLDQPGAGKGAAGSQASSPVYEWSNTANSSDYDLSVVGNCAVETDDHIKSNRDFYNDTEKPGYTTYSCPHPLNDTSNTSICTAQTGSTPNITGVTITKKTLIDELMLAIRTEE